MRLDELFGPKAAQLPWVNSPEFKAWFGRSKVVDQNGNPRVVFHGTFEDFKVFKLESEKRRAHNFNRLGFWFDVHPETPNYFAGHTASTKQANTGDFSQKAGSVVMAFLSRQFRHEVRCEERNGGQCGFVAEYIMDKFGWESVSGTYCNDSDEPICDGHVWNILPDGAIFDSTADQLGMGHDMKIVPPSDPDFKHYRYEWDDENEFTPDHPNAPDEIKGMKWSGKNDMDWSNEIRKERGEHWHVTDKKQHANYLKQEKAYQSGKADPKKPFK